LASGASFQFFVKNPEVTGLIKWAAAFFLAGLFLLAIAFFVLTILPLAIERVDMPSARPIPDLKGSSLAEAGVRPERIN